MVGRSLSNRLDTLEPLINIHAGETGETVYGVVDKIIDGKPNFVRKWKGTIGNMRSTDEEPTIFIIEKLEPAILKHKKYKCFYGGRAGTKSIMAMDAMIGDVNSNGSRVYVLRERMKSLKESIYSGIDSRIKEISMGGFVPVPSQWEIRHKSGGKFTFGGMHNIIDMKGSFKYKYFLMEEAAKTKQETIDVLGPTLRGVEGAELWYIWNNESATDPMSLEFIVPYQAELDRDGYYEDEYHLIIKVGHEDNPWFQYDESLRVEYEKDKYKNSNGLMSNARFNHIWKGAFNDDIEDGLIDPDWFDACIDAHIKLGFEAKGAVVTTHDPADVGKDAKTVSTRHGSVWTHMKEIDAVNGNRAFDEACGEAKKVATDVFGWDCDGMGALLRDQAAANFKGTKIHTYMFKGSEGVHNPDAICAYTEQYGIAGSKKNKDVFRNKRAQNYVEVAQRCFRTYEAVKHGKYYDPEELISFSSDIEVIQKLRAELCKLPLKPNTHGMIELYSKKDMRAGIIMKDGTRRVIPSPNLADNVMMSYDKSSIINHSVVNVRLPNPIRPMGRR